MFLKYNKSEGTMKKLKLYKNILDKYMNYSLLLFLGIFIGWLFFHSSRKTEKKPDQLTENWLKATICWTCSIASADKNAGSWQVLRSAEWILIPLCSNAARSISCNRDPSASSSDARGPPLSWLQCPDFSRFRNRYLKKRQRSNNGNSSRLMRRLVAKSGSACLCDV